MVRNYRFVRVAREGQEEVKQLVTPGFESLPLERKLFVYYLSQAFDLGHDISWQQMSRYGLPVRKLMEQIWLKRAFLYPNEKSSIKKYYYDIVSVGGLYDERSNQKVFLENLTESEFREVLKRLKLEAPDYLVRLILDPDAAKYFHAPGIRTKSKHQAHTSTMMPFPKLNFLLFLIAFVFITMPITKKLRVMAYRE